jgi:hypothetical protein
MRAEEHMSAQKRTNNAEPQQATAVEDLQVQELEDRIAPTGIIIQRR